MVDGLDGIGRSLEFTYPDWRNARNLQGDESAGLSGTASLKGSKTF